MSLQDKIIYHRVQVQLLAALGESEAAIIHQDKLNQAKKQLRNIERRKNALVKAKINYLLNGS